MRRVCYNNHTEHDGHAGLEHHRQFLLGLALQRPGVRGIAQSSRNHDAIGTDDGFRAVEWVLRSQQCRSHLGHRPPHTVHCTGLVLPLCTSHFVLLTWLIGCIWRRDRGAGCCRTAGRTSRSLTVPMSASLWRRWRGSTVSGRSTAITAYHHIVTSSHQCLLGAGQPIQQLS